MGAYLLSPPLPCSLLPLLVCLQAARRTDVVLARRVPAAAVRASVVESSDVVAARRAVLDALDLAATMNRWQHDAMAERVLQAHEKWSKPRVLPPARLKQLQEQAHAWKQKHRDVKAALKVEKKARKRLKDANSTLPRSLTSCLPHFSSPFLPLQRLRMARSSSSRRSRRAG